jgi:hypothetical protein
MTDLSPQAQAVLDTAGRRYAIDSDLQDSIAAALRAAAYHLDDHADRLLFGERYQGMCKAVQLLQAIANELENVR